jgi:glycine/serine hydroxymethyltransferase
MKENQMILIARLIDRVLKNPTDDSNLKNIKSKVVDLCNNYPIYQGINK